MIIKYPATNWNSFLSTSDLEKAMAYQFPAKATDFAKLDQATKDAAVMNAGTWIRTCKGLKLPEHTVPQDVVLAQVAIVASTIGQDPLAHDPFERAVIEETVGPITMKYDAKTRANADPLDINPLIYRLLAPFGCSKGNGFSQSRIN